MEPHRNEEHRSLGKQTILSAQRLWLASFAYSLGMFSAHPLPDHLQTTCLDRTPLVLGFQQVLV